jgi:hypothetical protein
MRRTNDPPPALAPSHLKYEHVAFVICVLRVNVTLVLVFMFLVDSSVRLQGSFVVRHFPAIFRVPVTPVTV